MPTALQPQPEPIEALLEGDASGAVVVGRNRLGKQRFRCGKEVVQVVGGAVGRLACRARGQV